MSLTIARYWETMLGGGQQMKRRWMMKRQHRLSRPAGMTRGLKRSFFRVTHSPVDTIEQARQRCAQLLGRVGLWARLTGASPSFLVKSPQLYTLPRAGGCLNIHIPLDLGAIPRDHLLEQPEEPIHTTRRCRGSVQLFKTMHTRLASTVLRHLLLLRIGTYPPVLHHLASPDRPQRPILSGSKANQEV